MTIEDPCNAPKMFDSPNSSWYFPNYPTHLGGDATGLGWYDLRADELVQASVGSVMKAAAILPVAEAQLNEARAQADRQAIEKYGQAVQILGNLAANLPLGIPVQSRQQFNNVRPCLA